MGSPSNVTVEGLDKINIDYTPNANDEILLITTGSSTDKNVFLPKPSPTTQGMLLYIKKYDSGSKAVVIDANTNGATLDGANTLSLATQYSTAQVFCDGEDWHLLAKYVPA